MRRPLACFFVCMEMEAFRRNAQPASTGCSFEKGLGSSQQAFCPGPKGHGAKNATWYQVALLAHSTLTLFALNCQRVLCGESQAVAWASHSHSDVPSRKPYYWCAKKADIPLPAHAAFAVLQANELLLHLTPAARTELIGFAHSICQGSHPCSCRQPAASGWWIPARFSAHPWQLWHPRWPFWIPACRWPSQRP